MHKLPLHEVAETRAFRTQLARLRVSESEHDAILDTYQSEPDRGAVIRGSGGIAKGRVAKDATGQSGGYRIFSLYINQRAPVFLLWIIDKTEDENITEKQKQAFRALAKDIKAIWSK